MGTMGDGSRGGAGLHRGELRLRIEAAFSARQLCDLAVKWGLEPNPAWEKSAADAAHGILREGERRLGLMEVVRLLKVERPLLEWPDVDQDAIAEWGPPSSMARPAPTALDLGEATTLDSPAAIRARAAGQASSASVGREASAPAESGESGPASSAPASRAPVSRSNAPVDPFPGTVVPKPPRQGIDPKILIGVAAAAVAVTAVAFGVGILLSRRADARARANPSGATRGPSPARVASDIFGTALAEVADRCDVEVEGPATRDILAFIQTDCGPGGPVSTAPRPKRSRNDTDPSVDTPSSTHKRRPPTAAPDAEKTAAPVAPRPNTRPTCLSACGSEHQSCVAGCGPEPSDASHYDAWLGCSSKCLSSESRCRLSCR